MRLIGLGFALAFALTAGQAVAAQPNWYAGGMVGLSVLHDSEDRDAFGNTSTTEFDAGIGFGFFGGWEFGNGVRAELELSYRHNGADRQRSPSLILDGSTSAFALMANGLYDFNINMGQLSPYLGAGLGFARVDADIDSGGVQQVDDSDVVFAYQFIAGVGYSITPQVVLMLDYRIFGTTDPELTDSSNIKFDAEYFTQNIMLGARYRF